MRRVLFHFVFITTVGLLAADKPWPVFAFQNGVHFSEVQQRIAVLKELGYDGIGSANLNADLPLPQRLKAYDDAGLKLFSFYVGGRLSGNGTKGHSYSPAITQALPHLKGRNTFLELYVQGNKRSNTDKQAVAFVQEIADQAKAHGVKIVLYPHTGFYIDRLSDAVRIARKAKRNNVGVMFNLCHFLRVEPKTDLAAALKDAAPFLWRVSTSGAEIDGTSWGQLIQTVDRGNYDQVALRAQLRAVGFQGPVGFQCYAIRGDSKTNLQRSINAWNKLK